MVGTLHITTLTDGTSSLSLTDILAVVPKYNVGYNSTSTLEIYESVNLTSLTDNSAGLQTANFTNLLADVDYTYKGVVEDTNSNGDTFMARQNVGTKTTSAFQFFTANGLGDARDTKHGSAIGIGDIA